METQKAGPYRLPMSKDRNKWTLEDYKDVITRQKEELKLYQKDRKNMLKHTRAGKQPNETLHEFEKKVKRYRALDEWV